MNRKELRAWWKFNRLPTTCRECHLVGLCRKENEDWKLHLGFCFLECDNKVITNKPFFRSMLAPKYFKTKAGNLDEYPIQALVITMDREIDKGELGMDGDVVDRCLDLLDEKDPRVAKFHEQDNAE